ncbi:13030_t:CDS:2, partial [Entrophospora sp. SA101]
MPNSTTDPVEKNLSEKDSRGYDDFLSDYNSEGGEVVNVKIVDSRGR